MKSKNFDQLGSLAVKDQYKPEDDVNVSATNASRKETVQSNLSEHPVIEDIPQFEKLYAGIRFKKYLSEREKSDWIK